MQADEGLLVENMNRIGKIGVLVVSGILAGISLFAAMPVNGGIADTETKLTASDGAAEDVFGWSVSGATEVQPVGGPR